MAKEKKLYIYYKDENGAEQVRYVADKWQWQDTVMGEQFVSFNANSELPINFAIGDYCVYRGETFTLNYIPSETQNAKPNRNGNGFVYEGLKFDSYQEELTRCQMRDITASTGKYLPSLGTNYTGSTTFSLYCGETKVNNLVYTPVCALAAKIQANLDAMYKDSNGKPLWEIIVNTTTYHEEFGEIVYDTHTDEKVLSFSNNFVSEAVAMIWNEFKLNFCIRGRKIYIGYELNDITTYDPSDPTKAKSGKTKFFFGYGKGNADATHQNRGLFQMKKISNSSQQIVTRLRAFGSKTNMPYRYYNKKYSLSQSLFPTNLMLPDTFQSEDVKEYYNEQRKEIYPDILDVKGDTNDSYIEKGDDASSCEEGVREGSAFWDGSNADLEEIYPTIEGVTYAELRAANIPDQDGNKGANAFPGYADNERIDEVLAICDDTNIGNGINYDESTTYSEFAVGNKQSLTVPTESAQSASITRERDICTFNNVAKGKYIVTSTLQSINIAAIMHNNFPAYETIPIKSHFEVKFRITPNDGSVETIKTYNTETIVYKGYAGSTKIAGCTWRNNIYNRYMGKVAFPTLVNDNELEVTKVSKVKISYKFVLDSGEFIESYNDTYPSVFGCELSNNNNLSLKETENLNGNIILRLENSADNYQDTPFHIIIKDIGFDIAKSFYDDDTARISMKNGHCVAREFPIGEVIEKVTVTRNGVQLKAYKLNLTSRSIDDVLNAFFPSSVNVITPGDRFVMLGIEMPDMYVETAEYRLLKAACTYLEENSVTKFTYKPYLDDLFIERDYDINIKNETPQDSLYWRLYAGVKFTFREIPKEEYETVINTLSVMIQTITIKEGEKYTPQIDITLNDDFNQSVLQKIQSSINSLYQSGGSVVKEVLNTDNLITKGKDEETNFSITAKGFKADEFSTKNASSSYGAKMYQDGDSNGHVETDFLTVRNAAFFRELTIAEVRHIGGEVILSQAACTISKVVKQYDSLSGSYYYRCYFEKEANGKRQYNNWRSGDLAYCKSFQNTEIGSNTDVCNKYYWRRVLFAGEDNDMYYINLGDKAEFKNVYSDVDCIPAENDNIVLLGHVGNDDPARCSAQIYSTVGANSPSRKYYQGINSFSLEGKEIETLEWDATNSYTHWKIGKGQDFVEFGKEGLKIQATSVTINGGGALGGNAIDVFILTQSEGKPKPRIEADGTKVSGDLYPFDWAESTYAKHENACCVTSPDGFCYQWKKVNGEWIWNSVSDKYLINAKSSLEGFKAEITPQMNTLTNYVSSHDTTWEAGLATKANYAELFADKVWGESLTKATLKLQVEDSISQADIMADKIVLTGKTMTFTGNQIVINTDNFKLDGSGNVEVGGVIKAKAIYHDVLKKGSPDETYTLNPSTDSGTLIECNTAASYILPLSSSYIGLEYHIMRLALTGTTSYAVFTTGNSDCIRKKSDTNAEYSNVRFGFGYARIIATSNGWLVIEEANDTSYS